MSISGDAQGGFTAGSGALAGLGLCPFWRAFLARSFARRSSRSLSSVSPKFLSTFFRHAGEFFWWRETFSQLDNVPLQNSQTGMVQLHRGGG